MRKKYTKKKATYVPTYKDGGQTKQEWISQKIQILMNEGEKQDRAVAIAMSMAEDMFQEGGQIRTLQEMQNLRLNPTLPPTQADSLMTFEEEQKSIAPQKPVDRILYNVQTSQPKQGLPEGNYTRVDYKDKTSDYLTPEGYENFKKMNNYRLYQEAQAKRLNQNPQLPPSYKNGGEMYEYQTGGINTNINPISLNTNTGMYEKAPAYNLLPAMPPAATNTSRWSVGQLPDWNMTPPPVGTVAANALPQGESVQVQQRPQLTAAEDVTINQLAPATTNTLNVQEQIQPAAQELNRAGQQYLGTTPPPSTGDSGSNQPFQFFNPYGGVDLETASTVLGQGIANKDPWSIVGGGLKLATGLGRNIAGGLGAQNRQNQIMQNYAEQQRDVVTQANRPRTLREQGIEVGQYQEGGEIPQEQGSQEEQIFLQVAGMLQQGATPEDVLGQLIQMGMTEEQATQILQMVMQELQGGQQTAPQQEQAPQEQPMMKEGGEFIAALKGKRIKDYTYNKDTDTYTVSYED